MRQGRWSDNSVDAVGSGQAATTEMGKSHWIQLFAMWIEEWCWMSDKRQNGRPCGGLGEARVEVDGEREETSE